VNNVSNSVIYRLPHKCYLNMLSSAVLTVIPIEWMWPVNWIMYVIVITSRCYTALEVIVWVSESVCAVVGLPHNTLCGQFAASLAAERSWWGVIHWRS